MKIRALLILVGSVVWIVSGGGGVGAHGSPVPTDSPISPLATPTDTATATASPTPTITNISTPRPTNSPRPTLFPGPPRKPSGDLFIFIPFVVSPWGRYYLPIILYN